MSIGSGGGGLLTCVSTIFSQINPSIKLAECKAPSLEVASESDVHSFLLIKRKSTEGRGDSSRLVSDGAPAEVNACKRVKWVGPSRSARSRICMTNQSSSTAQLPPTTPD